MNKIIPLYDAFNPKDFTAFDTSIDIKNLETGEVIFKGLKNKVIISGSSIIARKLFDVTDSEVIPNYNTTITGLYTPATDIQTGVVGIGASTKATKDNPKVLLFCCGTNGCGTENSQVYPVEYTKWINTEELVPFRYQLSGEDLSDELRRSYFGRTVRGGFIAYYFKTFETAPKFVQRYMDGTPINSTVFTSGKTGAESYVELTMRITKEDVRDFFINTTGIDRARVNCISLCTAYPVVENGYTYYKDIRPLTRLNFPNEQLIDLTKGIEIVYHIYM